LQSKPPTKADATKAETKLRLSVTKKQRSPESHLSFRAPQLATDTERNLAVRTSAGLGRPLRVPMFRNLLIADLVSDIGTFMQNVGAAWLMVSLRAGPGYVALIQTAASLPYFLLALPAGAAGDIFDRRKLILYTEAWMVGVALILAVLTISGLTSPWLLLVLTFALSAGDAFENPTWRAILPELVSKDDLAAASALNGIEFNLARAVGPAVAGAVIAAAGSHPVESLAYAGYRERGWR